MEFDVLIRNGSLVDGSGAPPFEADVGITGTQITVVGELGGAGGTEEIDAAGKHVLPGFIDTHAHSEVSLYINPPCHSQVAQGITTEVAGNCGYSAFPLLENNRGYLLEPEGVRVPWSTTTEFFDTLEQNGMGINLVPQVGHITVRAAVLDREDRPATPGEIEKMKTLVRRAMEAGARGLSTGLDYEPTRTSDLDELIELAKVVAEFGGFYSSHIRGYTGNVLNALAEAIQVGRHAGIPVQVSHLGISGRDNWGYMDRVRYLMDKARAEGVKVGCDMMAYRTSGAWWGPRAILPDRLYDWREPWEENLQRVREEISDPEAREELKAEIEANREGPKHGFKEEALIFSDWRNISIEELPEGTDYKHLLGLDMVEAASREEMEPCDLFLDLLANEGEEVAVVRFSKGQADFESLLTDEWTMFCTDTVGTEISLLAEPWNTIQPHRRHYGTFPRILAKFVRDEGLLTITEAVRGMSRLPADHFGLDGRGRVKEGYAADLVVVDLERVAERGTWREPAAYPVGIDYVLVNGAVAVSDGEVTGELCGQMLRSGR